MNAVPDSTGPQAGPVGGPPVAPIRFLGWSIIAVTFVYFIDTYLTVWLEWPGSLALFSDAREGTGRAALQCALYLVGIALGAGHVLRSGHRGLREDAMTIAAIARYVVKAAFWAVVLIGLVDAVISFLRVENLLPALVGEEMATNLGRPRFRGPYVHVPMAVFALAIAARSRTLGFPWLALLVVVAELLIVLSRFVFSYEQTFQGDLVRFWHGALFLFASAHTLFEDGHVRVDVFYTGFPQRKKGAINAIGCLFLGITLCWTILTFGMGDKSSIITAPLLTYEVSASSFGMHVKYWMAGFLAVFALSMTIQFTGYFMESVADFRGDPGRREPLPAGGH